MEFSRQEYWSGLPFPSPRDLPYPEMEPSSPISPVHSESSSMREGVRQLLGSPSSTVRVERGRADLGLQWACCSPSCPVLSPHTSSSLNVSSIL